MQAKNLPLHIDEIPTPALLLDAKILERNLVMMQNKISALGSSLRPHIKTHKCIEIGRQQQKLGAKGITVSTFYEAQEFARAGFDDITWAFPLPPVYARRAVDLSNEITFRVVVDSREAVESFRNASRDSKKSLHVWLKVDCGYHRAGVDPGSPLAEELIRSLADSKQLHFDGILSHSGHAYHGSSRTEILKVANQERDVMVGFAERMRKEGYFVPVVSIGSTPSMSVIEDLAGISEVRPGNYCFYDRTMVELGVCSPGDCALSVLASVISHQPGASHFVVDAGALALSKDIGKTSSLEHPDMGSIYEDYDHKSMQEDLVLETLSQEHGKVIAGSPSEIEGRFKVGDRVRILENHSCLTVAHFDEYYVLRGGEVIDRWKVLRGRV